METHGNIENREILENQQNVCPSWVHIGFQCSKFELRASAVNAYNCLLVCIQDCNTSKSCKPISEHT